jgi:hypothetical protein
MTPAPTFRCSRSMKSASKASGASHPHGRRAPARFAAAAGSLGDVCMRLKAITRPCSSPADVRPAKRCSKVRIVSIIDDDTSVRITMEDLVNAGAH